MIAIEKIYCSFELSKLLKEKGFNEYSFFFYNNKKELDSIGKALNNASIDEGHDYGMRTKCEVSAPTHEEAIIWLKENHNIWIYCYPSNWKEYGEWEGGACWIDENVSVIFNNSSHSLYANEPEEVIEMVLLYVLRNII